MILLMIQTGYEARKTVILEEGLGRTQFFILMDESRSDRRRNCAVRYWR